MVDNTTSSNKSSNSSSSIRPVRTPQGKPASSMAELMSRSGGVQTLQKGQIIEGIIKKLTSKEILMDIGAKGDALVIEFDKQNLENLLSFLKVGDRVAASVISPESEEGFPVVSLRRTLDDFIFNKFDDMVKGEAAFEVEIVESTRGGYYAVTTQGIKGFLPSSQVVDTENPVGRKIQVKILEYDRPKKRVLFSQKALTYVMNPAKIQELVKRDEVISATVSGITPYGLYVTVTPKKDVLIEGFVHISEIAYEHVTDLANRFKIGEKIEAKVLEVDSTNKRINLSIKQTKKDAFTEVAAKYKKEDKVKGKVVEVKSRGVTVQIDENIRGFIPSDKIGSGATFKVGEEVSAEVVDFDERRRVIVLSPILKAVPIGYR